MSGETERDKHDLVQNDGREIQKGMADRQFLCMNKITIRSTQMLCKKVNKNYLLQRVYIAIAKQIYV